jgi:hypothetical protein
LLTLKIQIVHTFLKEILINIKTTFNDGFAVLKVLDIMVRVPGMVKQMTGVDVTNVRRGTSVY